MQLYIRQLMELGTVACHLPCNFLWFRLTQGISESTELGMVNPGIYIFAWSNMVTLGQVGLCWEAMTLSVTQMHCDTFRPAWSDSGLSCCFLMKWRASTVGHEIAHQTRCSRLWSLLLSTFPLCNGSLMMQAPISLPSGEILVQLYRIEGPV